MFNEPKVSNKLPRTVKLPTVILPVAVIDPAVDIFPPITLPVADINPVLAILPTAVNTPEYVGR